MSDNMNEEFDLGLPPTSTKKTTSKKVATTPPQVAPVEPEIDPELDRANWPVIHIEMEDGKPNWEYIASHGTLKNGDPFGHELQVMRGVDVAVPPSIVNTLREAVATHHVPRRDPATGKLRLERQDRSAIPWRLIKAGKHIA